MIKKKKSLSSYFGDDNETIGNNLANRTNSDIINAIFTGNSDEVSDSRVQYVDVNVDDITLRPVNKYSQSMIDKLARSIKNTNNRLIHPIVIVDPRFLPENSEVLQKFKEKNVNLDEVKYVLVAGERRLKAWKVLRQERKKEIEEEIAKSGIVQENPFDTITANILTKEEAKNEKAYYEDSNNLSRQLTPIEGILHIQDALSDTKTAEQKRAALIEMNGGEEEGIPTNPYEAAKKFVQHKYIAFFLENELGLNSWSESTIKTYLSIVNNCSEEVIDAILQEEFNAKEARNFTKLPFDTQNTLLKMYKEDRKKYDEKIKVLNGKNKKSESAKKLKTRDAYREVNKFVKSVKKNQEKLKPLLNESNNDELKELSAQIDLFIVSLTNQIKGKI